MLSAKRLRWPIRGAVLKLVSLAGIGRIWQIGRL